MFREISVEHKTNLKKKIVAKENRETKMHPYDINTSQEQIYSGCQLAYDFVKSSDRLEISDIYIAHD